MDNLSLHKKRQKSQNTQLNSSEKAHLLHQVLFVFFLIKIIASYVFEFSGQTTELNHRNAKKKCF